MSEANLEKRLGDLERRHDKTRGLLVNALSLTVLGLVGFYYKPEGIHADIWLLRRLLRPEPSFLVVPAGGPLAAAQVTL